MIRGAINHDFIFVITLGESLYNDRNQLGEVMKTCITCYIDKELSEFNKESRRKDGVSNKCRSCIKLYMRDRNKKMGKNVYRNKLIDDMGDGKCIIYMRELGETLNIRVDPEDYNLLSKYMWGSVKGYASAWIDGKAQKMHRINIGAVTGDIVDHISGDIRDNRKCNLRICNSAENSRHLTKLQKNNVSGHMGVVWHKRDKRWMASICVSHKSIHLGYFTDLQDAIKARTEAEIKFHGEYKQTIE